MTNMVQQENPLTNPTSPFFLHPNESSGLVMVSLPLYEFNYHLWCKAMTLALESKNKLGFMDGNILEPKVRDPQRVSWQENTIILSWITRTLLK